MTIEEWLTIGIDKGWCGPVVCETHDGTPLSEEESESFNQGDDICIHILRLYYSTKHRDEVEKFDSPSQWRKQTK